MVGRCPECGEEYRMADWVLFYGDHFPRDAREAVQDILSRPKELKQQYVDLKRDSTTRTAERSARVKIGQTVEQIVQSLPTFPYRKSDCRSLFKPVDYVIFEGLTDKFGLDGIHFVDIKTGNAGLDPHEKQIKRAIEKKRVEFVRY